MKSLPKFISKVSMDNWSALVQAMAFHQAGDKPLPEPIMTPYTDA